MAILRQLLGMSGGRPTSFPFENNYGLPTITQMPGTPMQENSSLITKGRQRSEMVGGNPLGFVGQALSGGQARTTPKNFNKLLFGDE